MESMIALLKKRIGVWRFIQRLLWWSSVFGFDMGKFIFGITTFRIVLKEYFALRTQNEKAGLKWNLKFSTPCLVDRYKSSGTASGQTFHQDLLVARRIFSRQPVKHVDVGSRIDSFVAHVATFRPIEVLDIRPQTAKVTNIVFRQCDLMNLPSDLSGYCDSLSCLHVLEHFGLGRYGDPLDINGHLKGFNSLYKMLQQNGILYLSSPIGTERIEFNARRVFAIKTIIELAKSRFELARFSYVDDEGELHENVTLDDHALSGNFGLHYGCGIFEFRKV